MPQVSFRDPAGACGIHGDRVFRKVHAASVSEFEEFLKSPCSDTLVRTGLLIATHRLSEAELEALATDPDWRRKFAPSRNGAVYEHPRIPFPSYPHEWPCGMLWEAGRTTLDIAAAALASGWDLKDASPQNVLFAGGRAVFIDLLSFERRRPTDPVWRPYAQFVRTFLLPLLAHRLWGVRLADVFLTRRDGLEPEEVYRWCGPLDRFRPGVLQMVSLPCWLSGKARRGGTGLYQPRDQPADKARFIVESMLRRLRRALRRLESSPPRATTWSGYMQSHSYSGAAFTAKEAFVREALQELKPRDVLDVGANTGHFSRLAAGAGARVVAIDLDPACVDAIWRNAVAQSLDVLPLVVNLARPSPPLGWRCGECPSFLDRAHGRFGCLLMLAVLHHLIVTERIPLEDVIRLAAELTTDGLVIEFVPPEDPMFREIARGRENLHAGLTAEHFEAICSQHFAKVRALTLPESGRRVYLLRKHDQAR